MGKQMTRIDDREPGQIVFIGSERRQSHVLVLWTEYGCELEALRHVQFGNSEKLWVLGARCMSERVVNAFR